MVENLIFIASMILTGVISSHVTYRLFIENGLIESKTLLYPYPLYACIIALGAVSYVVWKESYSYNDQMVVFLAIFVPAYITATVLLWPERKSI